MKNIKNQKGITLLELVVTIVVMMILVISITMNISSTLELRNYYEVKEDIIALTEGIQKYYAAKSTLPTSGVVTFDIDSLNSADKNPNDNSTYYEINISALKSFDDTISLNREEDTYVVNEQSLTVYYPNGIKLDGVLHYTVVDTFESGGFASDYYTNVDIPIISVVTIESNGKDKKRASEGDTVTLKILSNYTKSEFTQLPTITINNKTINSSDWTWDSAEKCITISYVVEAQEEEKINFSISEYSVTGGKTGNTITEPTFGYGVAYVEEESIPTTIEEAKSNEMLSKTEKTELELIDGTVVIPEGFKIASDSAETVAGGVVIEDKDDNQFVWIPVDSIADYKRTAYSVSVATGTIDETTNSEQIRHSSSSSYYYTEAMPEDEKTSVETYKGFYIGRYEAGDAESTEAQTMRASGASTTNTVTLKKGQAPYNYVKKTQAQSLAEGMKEAQGYQAKTKLCSSYAWDTAIAFIRKTNSDYGNSSEEGNYKDTGFDYTDITGASQTKDESSSTLVPTGQTTAVCNIYDMGGNCFEWTTELYSLESYPYTKRGGDYNDNYVDYPAGYRISNSNSAYVFNSFRPTLFM